MNSNVAGSPKPPRGRRGRRTHVLLAIAAASTLASTGVASASASAHGRSAHGTKVVDLTWETMWSGNTLTLLKQMTTAFNATHPGIHVTETNIPSATGDAKLASQIAAGDPPNVFTEWNPVLGEYAANGSILPMTPYLTGAYKNFEKWEYPLAAATGTYKGQLYAIPMSMNSWALYYNKSIMKAAGIKSPPTTLKQLLADGAKEWIIKNGKLDQIGFYPTGNATFFYYAQFFGALNSFNSAGKYDFAHSSGAMDVMKMFQSLDKYPYAQVNSMEATFGAVAGGDDDAFVAGKEGFNMDGPWEGIQNIPVTNPKMEKNFGVVPFPGTLPGPSTPGQGNFNIIPKGASNPAAAFEFITWLAGYNNIKFTSTEDPKGGWMPAGPAVAAAPAYQKWVAANPYLKVYLAQMSSKYSQAPRLTPTESQVETAEATASDNVLEGTMTPAAALAYIDAQGNSGS
ncbi:MAG: extracellular solute-binding protein [Acidimicrobiales bacterium]